MSKRIDSRKEAARVVRDQLAREQRRRQQLLTTVGALVLLLIAGATGWFIYNSQEPSTYTAPKNTYKNDTGLVVGSGPTVLEVFVDYQCPMCKNFELGVQDPSSGQVQIVGMMDRLTPLLAQQKVKVVYQPVAILDHTSPNKYSTRAAASAGCASDENKISDYTKLLMERQVEEGTAGPTDEQLIEYGQSIGLGKSFEKCVKDRKYLDWVSHVTREAENRGLTGTPTIFVNNKQVEQKENETLPAFLDRVTQLVGGTVPSATTPAESAGASQGASTPASTAPSTNP